MQASESNAYRITFALFAAAASISCNAVVGLDDFAVNRSATPAGECATNLECSERLTPTGATEPVPAICEKTTKRCVPLLTEDCDVVTGDASDDEAIVLGSLFSTQGAQRMTNLHRQQSAMLAVTQINRVGGIPAASGNNPRKIVLVSCDESTNLMRAAGHLVSDLDVPGIVGPNTSQDTIDLSAELSVDGDTVLMSPTAVASSIASLTDNDLTWLMVPTDEQRAPLMMSQINVLETELKTDRNVATIKLGVVFRDDALGTGTRVSLNTLVINGKPLADAVNLGRNVQIDDYDFTEADQSVIVRKYLEFAPDIIVLAGTAEAITNVMKPLETQWLDATRRPYYVLIDSVKVPDLITLVTDNEDLRKRIRGTGITPDPASVPVYNGFKVDYQVEYSVASATTSGMGPAYDATYAMAFALAATKDQAVSGSAIAEGLRMLSGGPTRIDVGGTKATLGFQKLAAGEKIAAVGTFAPLEWDANGAVVGGTLEMWCIGAATGTPTYQSSGLTFDIKTQKEAGQYVQCGPL